MKKALKAVAAVLLCGAISVTAVGYLWGVGPLTPLYDIRTSHYPGNSEEYNPENIAALPASPLSGKTLIFLGSSVTYGAASQGISFADDIARRNNCTVIKEAVSGTTLVDRGNSYVRRLKEIEADNADVFVCQLSTNDATKKMPLGTVQEADSIEDYNTDTVAGAIQYIAAYAKEKWQCPIVFYTNAYYESERYEAMVALLHEIEQKDGVIVIDLYSNTDFNRITDEERRLYMRDKIHPTKAGYLLWWTPAIEEGLFQLFS